MVQRIKELDFLSDDVIGDSLGQFKNEGILELQHQGNLGDLYVLNPDILQIRFREMPAKPAINATYFPDGTIDMDIQLKIIGSITGEMRIMYHLIFVNDGLNDSQEKQWLLMEYLDETHPETDIHISFDRFNGQGDSLTYSLFQDIYKILNAVSAGNSM